MKGALFRKGGPWLDVDRRSLGSDPASRRIAFPSIPSWMPMGNRGSSMECYTSCLQARDGKQLNQQSMTESAERGNEGTDRDSVHYFSHPLPELNFARRAQDASAYRENNIHKSDAQDWRWLRSLAPCVQWTDLLKDSLTHSRAGLLLFFERQITADGP